MGPSSDYSAQTLKEQLAANFPDFEVESLPALPNPSEAYDPHRRQYHSTRILALLEKHVQTTQAARLLGLAAFDLYIPGMNYLFGEAHCPGSAAIISTRRLKPHRSDKSELLGDRVLKEAVHEIGHMLGLKHCNNDSCVMYFSEDIRDTDRKNHTFCAKCGAELGR